jgi:hypothetical protein
LFQGMREVVSRGAVKNEVASVLLFTDGQANTGISDAATIVKIMKEGGWKDANLNRPSFGSPSHVVLPQQLSTPKPPTIESPKRSRKSSRSIFSMFGFGSSNVDDADQQVLPPAYSEQQEVPQMQQVQQQEVHEDEVKVTEDDTAEEEQSPDELTFTVNTFGFGSNHNEDLLKAIADAGNGLYFYIENKEVIADAFIDCVGGLLSVVAQQIKVTIQGCEGVELLDVITSYPKAHMMVDGKPAIQVTFKDMQSEESRDCMCKVKLPQIEQPTDAYQLVHAKCEYDNMIVQPPAKAFTEIISTVSRPGADDKFEMEVNPEVDKQVNRVHVAAALEEATKTADRGDLETARTKLRGMLDQLQTTVTFQSPEVTEMKERCEESLTYLENKRDYNAFGSKASKVAYSNYQQQRFVGRSAGLYENSKKKQMKSSYAMFKGNN